jgi:DNA-binding transcriptional LysR family regulator
MMARNDREQHRDLTVDLTLNGRFVDLVEEGIDVAVRFGEVQDVNLVARRLGRARRVIVATPAYLKRHGTPKLPADLASHRGVLIGYPAPLDWTLSSAEGEIKVRVPVAFRANNGHVVRGAIPERSRYWLGSRSVDSPRARIRART